MKKYLCLVLLQLCIVQQAGAQLKPYYGPLLYSMHRDTSVPPIYVGQPLLVTTGYLWLDQAMRSYPEYTIEQYMKSMSWGDSLKTLASIFYQVQDDNPVSFFLWDASAIRPNPYKGVPSHGIFAFQKFVGSIAGDSGITGALLTADVIADVLVVDTLNLKDPTAQIAFDGVLVQSEILDPIKGKKIPVCLPLSNYKTKKSGDNTQSVATQPYATVSVAADSGSCLQFEYSPEWLRHPSDYGVPLIDSSGGWWIKPRHEYIVLLNFSGMGSDSSNIYFTTVPGPAHPSNGSNGCMYAVENGIVQDRNDDFNIGARSGLTVAEWKKRLRARIYKIVNP